MPKPSALPAFPPESTLENDAEAQDFWDAPEQEEALAAEGAEEEELGDTEEGLSKETTTEEPEQLEVAAPEETESEESLEPEGLSEPASKRFQKLANQNRELQEKQKAAEERQNLLIEKLEAAQRQQNEFQQKAWAETEAARQRQQAQYDQEAYRASMLQNGLDPADATHQLFFQNKLQQERDFAALQNQVAELNRRNQANEYQAALRTEVSKGLESYSVDAAQQEAFVQNAMHLAQALQLQPADAAKQVLAPVVGLLTKKVNGKKQTKRISAHEAVAHEAIAHSGSSGGRKPGDRSSGAKKDTTLDQAREATFGASGW